MTELSYGGKRIADLTDRHLEIAENDVAGQLLHAFEAPALAPVPPSGEGADKGRYAQHFNRLSDLANAIRAEKLRRGT